MIDNIINRKLDKQEASDLGHNFWRRSNLRPWRQNQQNNKFVSQTDDTQEKNSSNPDFQNEIFRLECFGDCGSNGT